LVFPAKASGNLQTVTTERHRSLFKVPVFQADLKLDSTFDLKGVPSVAPQDARLEWGRAEIVVGVSDPRGALADATVATGGRTVNLTPAELANDISFGPKDRGRIKLILLGTKVADIARPEASFRATASLKFSGAQRVALLSYGKTTQLRARGDWRNPGFDGGILPVTRTVSNSGFSAEWSVPFIARGVRAEGPIDSVAELSDTTLGISFIEVVDAYQSSTDRSNMCC
jgi:inner membrane protein